MQTWHDTVRGLKAIVKKNIDYLRVNHIGYLKIGSLVSYNKWHIVFDSALNTYHL